MPICQNVGLLEIFEYCSVPRVSGLEIQNSFNFGIMNGLKDFQDPKSYCPRTSTRYVPRLRAFTAPSEIPLRSPRNSPSMRPATEAFQSFHSRTRACCTIVTCTCTRMHTYAGTYIHTYIHTYLHTYIHVYIHRITRIVCRYR